MKSRKIAIEPKSQPDWKEALLIVLLLFFVAKSGSSLLSVFAIGIAGILSARFLATSFLLFRFNMAKWGSKIVIDTENGNAEFQNLNGENHRIVDCNFKKLPFTPLHFMRFRTMADAKAKTLLLNEQELEFTKGYLSLR